MTKDLSKKLTINEIFFSIQGESYLAGLPCIFIRLTGCHQRCVYCDTEYAFFEGEKMTLEQILTEIKKYSCKNVLITGGEPLLQSNTVLLMEELIDRAYTVAVETSGNRDVSCLPREVIKVMDLKTPCSGEAQMNNYNNIKYLDSKDEIKFVVMNEQDIDWSIAMIGEKKLENICHVSVSPTSNDLNAVIADKILKSGMKIRQQVQLHKLIWPQKERGY